MDMKSLNKLNSQQGEQDIKVRPAVSSDISFFVALSYEKRRAYEKAQPQFWGYAQGAEEAQTKYFEKLITDNNHIMLTAESEGKIVGFIDGSLVVGPPVYDPGGLNLWIDDFCMDKEADWNNVGRKLIDEIKLCGKARGCAQIVVVSGAHDKLKREFLKSMGLTVSSEFFVVDIK